MSRESGTDTSFFDLAFHALTGNDPFSSQQDFFRRLVAGERVAACIILAGVGKTASPPPLPGVLFAQRGTGYCAEEPRFAYVMLI
jgi:hypothetical protein